MSKEKDARNLEIITDVSNGISKEKIAESFGLGKRTIGHIVDRLRLKYGCATETQLVAKLIRDGIIK